MAITKNKKSSFMKVFDLMDELVIVTRLDDGAIYGVNRAFEAAMGITQRRAQGKTSVTLDYWVDLKQRDEYLKLVRKHKAVEGFAATVRAPAGAELEVLLDASCIEEEGIQYIVTVLKRTRLLRKFSAADSRLMRMFEQSPVPMSYVRREDTDMTYYNEAWFKAFGFDRARDQGKSGVELGIWVEPTQRAQIVEHAVQGKETIAEEVKMLDAHGNPKWISYTLRLAKDKETELFLISYLDVTEHKSSQGGVTDSEAAARADLRHIERRTADNRRAADRHVKLNSLDAVAKDVLGGQGNAYARLNREERLYVALATNRADLLKQEGSTIAQAIGRIGTDWTAELAARWEFVSVAESHEAAAVH